MKKPDTILDEIHSIRRRIDEKTKGMTHAEINEYYRNAGESAARKYGFTIVDVDTLRGYPRQNVSSNGCAYKP